MREHLSLIIQLLFTLAKLCKPGWGKAVMVLPLLPSLLILIHYAQCIIQIKVFQYTERVIVRCLPVDLF